MKYQRPNLFAVSILLVLLSACSQPLTLEQQIISTIRKMEEKIEAGERRPFMKHIAEDFTAQNGSMNRDQARALMIIQLNRYKRLQAQLFPIRVSSTGDGTPQGRYSGHWSPAGLAGYRRVASFTNSKLTGYYPTVNGCC